jgi:hypothetical protein
MLFFINLEYLKKLNSPEEAITNEVWNHITNTIKERAVNNEKYSYIINKRINEVAPYFGVLWNNLKDDPTVSYIDENYTTIYNQKFTREWFKRSLVLTVFGLYELTNEEEINKLYDKVYNMSAKEVKDLEQQPYYESNRISINDFLTKEKANIKDDTFDSIYKEFIKYVIKLLITNGQFQTEDIKKYINIMYKRFVNKKGYAEIGEELNIKHGSVSNILSKFVTEFKKSYQTEEQLAYLCRKFENFYEEAFNKLDKSNLENRNERLEGLKMFQNAFITESLGTYIN